MDESQRKQIWKMRAEGLGYGLIGRATGLSRDSVKKYCKRNPALLGHGAATKQMAKADQNDGIRCPQCYQTLKTHKIGSQRSSVRINVVKFGGPLILTNTTNQKLHMKI